ncbi:MFS transporter [Pseudoalteromonas sp. B28]|uniref:MFS transporter n=1 Tax=Pseudoalteromonas TaxID=53246 RepID=UPI001193E38B|nr:MULTISPECIES: MFS transporter [Pseudoalteromonas]MBB1306057.1 MFS transporter [Pseudoalteromonas sp. SR43-5]MBB1349583.1 MFS transporter [Pseudoalteromonas sp. SG45-3]MBB1358758.1 MFS transporter [Pseudoalteromonas sp. SG45-6]MBB1432142.1 MFS transporter [Pseudoalteromonas sp. SG43-4]MBB1441772.1 MFS transporter [Pseudoalteromonas sp. SG43-3]
MLNNTPKSRFAGILLVLGILLIAANLRATFTGIAPVLEQIINHFGLSASQAGFLTTLPLIAFAVASPMAATLAKKQGLERTLFVALLFILAGVAARVINTSAMLFVGTAIIGVGIAIANVLLPSLIKRDFPAKVALMTSAYVLTMGVVSGGFSTLVFPLSQLNGLGWQLALGSSALITLASIIVWMSQLSKHTKPASIAQHTDTSKSVWRYLLAWQITLLLGLNSFLNYIIITWLPSILTETGHSATQAGAYHGAFQIATALPGLILIPLLAKLKDQSALSFILAMLSALSALGLLYMPSFAFVWTLMLGFCSGACFILGLSFISLRTDDSQQAASLSGMSQSVGYLLAAIGPMLAGALHTTTGSWSAPLWLCAIAGVLCALCGLGSGKNTTLAKSAN